MVVSTRWRPGGDNRYNKKMRAANSLSFKAVDYTAIAIRSY
jgi:hypothetical protein